MEKKPDFEKLAAIAKEAIENDLVSLFASDEDKLTYEHFYLNGYDKAEDHFKSENERLLSALKELSDFVERMGVSPVAGFEYRRNAKELIKELINDSGER